MLKTEGLGGKQIAYMKLIKNIVMPHGLYIYAKSYDMVKSKMCAYSQSDHVLPQCKCLFQCCAQFPSINIPDH